MKKDQRKLLQEKSDQELAKQLMETKNELVRSKIDLKMRKLKNVHEITQKKQEIARIKTILRARELKV